MDQKTKQIVERLRGPKAVWDGDLQIAASLIESLSERVGELERVRDTEIKDGARLFRDTRIAVYTAAATRGEIPCAQIEILADMDKIQFIRALLSKQEERG